MPRFAVFLAALAFSAAAFAQDVTFGASVQLTGPVANTGRYYKDAYEFAVDKINAAGGIKIGSQQHKIALKLLDNQSDVNLSVRQYTQLISQDKVNFLLGPFASNFVLADSSVAEKASVPMVQGGGASDEIYTRGYKYVFGTLPAASDYFGSTIEALVNAIEAAGSLDAAKVRDALAKTNFESLYGHVAFNDKGQISLPQLMIQIQNDQVVEIYAGGKFAHKLVYPLPPWDKR